MSTPRQTWLPQPGRRYGFYGVDNLTLKLDAEVIECVEDESDGYRSSMENLYVAEPGKHIFFRKRIDTVTVEAAPAAVPGEYGEFSGWQLVSTKPDRHVWLTMGTSNTDDYYPSFCFRYTPRTEVK